MADSASSPHKLRFYWAHHFVVIPLALLVLLYAGRHYVGVSGSDDVFARIWFAVALLALTVLSTVVMMRQHYALGLQDRVIRLEVCQRYFEVTGRSLRPLEGRLSMKQIVALRFAPDAQLPALAEAAAQQQLTPQAIIAQIGAGYQPDLLRL